MKIGKSIFTWKLINVQLTENKSFEYQFEPGKKFARQPFGFYFSWTTEGDHNGLSLTFSLYKLFWVSFEICDHRHWNWDEKRFYLPGEIEEILDQRSFAENIPND